MKQRNRFLIVMLVLALTAAGFAWTAPAQAQAPAAPILVVVNSAAPNKFGPYLAEILRAEGLNAFEVKDLGALSAGDLAAHDLTILADTPLSAAQAALFTNHVAGGGRLLAMRPDAQIAGLFGLAAPSGTLSDGYIQIDTAALLAGELPGSGLPTATLQTHGAASLYALSGGVQIARLFSDASAATAFPAVAGAATGRTAAFTYDLPMSVVYSRQGNPASANVDRDGDALFRTIDLFQAVNGGPTWVDRDRMPIPQADVQQRLFARLVRQLVSQSKPLPQLWYFPGASKTMIIPTGDAHANPTNYYQNEIDSLAPYGGKMTFYLSQAADPQPANVAAWTAQGYDFGIHPYVNASFPTGYSQALSWFQSYYQRNPGRSVRNHQVLWSGWTDAATVAAQAGFALDANFYTWGTWLQRQDGSWPYGYVTGSGRPMRFISAQGEVIPVYQQVTQLVDEYLFNVNGMQNLTGAQGIAISQQMIDASQAGDYAALMTQFHVDYYNGDAQQWAEGTLAFAQSLGIPIWNAEQWLNFTETRDGANFSAINWNSASGQLDFNLSAGSATPTLSFLLPPAAGGRLLTTVLVDGAPAAFSNFTVAGRDQALVTVAADNHSVIATYAGPPPTATNTPLPPPTFTPTNTPTGAPTTTPINTPTPTSTTGPTATPTTAPGGVLTLTTYGDFEACGVGTDVVVTSLNGGALRLAPALVDDFDGAALDGGRWLAGTWAGGAYAPAPTAGALTIAGGSSGWVRSQSVYTHGEVEFVAEFGAGAWQHLGFGSVGFEANRYLIFSTAGGGGNLYARANNNSSEQYSNLGPIPTGAHRYHIAWGAIDASNDRVRFSLDGQLRAEFTVPAQGGSNYLVYLSNNGAAPLRIDRVTAGPAYATTGTWSSCALDAGASALWSGVAWQGEVLPGGSVTVQARWSPDAVTWSDWAAVPPAGLAINAPARVVQYSAALTGSGAASSSLDAVILSASAFAPTPTPAIPPTATPTNTATAVPPTATPVPPTATPVPPTATPAPPTATPVPPTATPVPPTATAVPPTATAVPPTATAVPPTATPAPPTATPAPPTATPAPPTATPSVPVTPVNDTVTFTNFADLNAPCVLHENTFATSAGGGAVTLLATLDTFDAAALDTGRWLSGSWSGGVYAPTPAGGRLTLPGDGYVRSIATQRLGELDVNAEFGRGAWQHIGFAPDGFGANQYLIFSTFTGDGNLYARTNNNASEQRVNLGPMPVGAHRFAVAWNALNASTDQAIFSIDGQAVATLQAPAPGASNYAVYLSNNGAAVLGVDELHVAPPYAPAGTYTGCVLDATSGGWASVAWNATTPASTAIAVQARTSPDTLTWSAWAALATSGAAPTPQGRYLQYRVQLNSTDAGRTPRLDSITVAPVGATGSAAEAIAPDAQSSPLWESQAIFLPLVNQ